MFYYTKDNSLYSSDIRIASPDFSEITMEEYNAKLSAVKNIRECGEVVENADEWR